MEWIRISVKHPTPCKTVLVVFENKHGGRFVTMAQYVPPKTILSDDFLSEEAMGNGFEEYDEEKDCYWTPAGWYEWQYVAEQHYFLDERVTHWAEIQMPLCPII